MASFRKRGKKWEYRISYYVNGKRVYEDKGGFNSKREAQFAATEHQAQLNKGVQIAKGNATFFEYMSHWAELYKKNNVSEVTYSFILRAVKLSETLFNGLNLNDINKTIYQSALNTLNDKSPATVKKYHTYFKGCFQSAVDDGILLTNPAKKAIITGNKQKQKHETIKYLSYEDAKKLAKSVKQGITSEYTTRYMILLALFTGMRYAEILGLTWDRIDFEQQIITIDRSWDYKFTNSFISTKNKETRKITVSQNILVLLSELSKDKKGLVFVKADKTLPTNNAVNKSLQHACKRAGIHPITFHGLRHTHGSILLYKGASLLYISKRLGHASTLITQEVYLHLLDEMKKSDDHLTQSTFSNF